MLLRILRQCIVLTITLAIGGFAGCLLLRFSPGFDTTEQDLNPRYSATARQALHQARASERNVFAFYARYLANAAHGDLGVSTAFDRPVAELIAARAPATLRLIAFGIAAGWAAGLLLGVASALRPAGPLPLAAELLSGLLLCLPAAVLALLVFLAGGPASLVIAAALFPRVFRYSYTLISDSLTRPHILAAAARGIPRSQILRRYLIPPTIAPLAALLAVSVTLAFGAAIPVEVVCDIPGLGQLAWKAALARDLPLLAAMVLLVTAATLTANAAADLAQ